MFHLLALDPAYAKPVACADLSKGQLTIFSFNLPDFHRNPGSVITLTDVEERHAVIESQYVGRANPKTALKLAQTAGELKQGLRGLGFWVHDAPTWGKVSWIRDMLSCGGRMPDRKQIADLSMLVALDVYPQLKDKINGDDAAAICILHWYLDRNKWAARGLKK